MSKFSDQRSFRGSSGAFTILSITGSVTVPSDTPAVNRDEPAFCTVHLRVANVGFNPAHDVSVWSTSCIVRMCESEDTGDELMLCAELGDPAILNPRRSFDFRQTVALLPSEINDLRNGSARLMARGRACFIDVFGLEQWSGFCLHLTVDTIEPPSR